MEHLEIQLAAGDVALDQAVLDRIDEIGLPADGAADRRGAIARRRQALAAGEAAAVCR